jgi:hypothetical protein
MTNRQIVIPDNDVIINLEERMKRDAKKANHSRLRDMIIGGISLGMIVFGSGNVIYKSVTKQEVNPVYLIMTFIGSVGCGYACQRGLQRRELEKINQFNNLGAYQSEDLTRLANNGEKYDK